MAAPVDEVLNAIAYEGFRADYEAEMIRLNREVAE